LTADTAVEVFGLELPDVDQVIVEEGGEVNIATKEEEGKNKDSTNNKEVEANGSSSHLYFPSRTAPIGFLCCSSLD
jgi:hypothetical protein